MGWGGVAGAHVEWPTSSSDAVIKPWAAWAANSQLPFEWDFNG